MARKYANIATLIWRNEDFVARTIAAQHLYLLLATQADISAAGVLSLNVRRWSARSSDATPASIVSALRELEAARFVIYDNDTEELLVRSFVRWDGGHTNPKRRPVIIRAATEVESPKIRRALAGEFVRLGLPVDGLADSLSGSQPLSLPDGPSGDRGDPLSTGDELAVHNESSQANSLSDSVSPSEGVVVTKGPYEGPTTHNPQSPPSVGAPSSATSRGTRLPEDWKPSQHLLEWLAGKSFARVVDVELETEKFRNHFLSKAGKDAAKRSWDRTWQNWMIEAAQRRNRNGRMPTNGAGYPQADSNAPKRIPLDEQCSLHPSERRGRCGRCRSERLAGDARAGPDRQEDTRPPTSTTSRS